MNKKFALLFLHDGKIFF